MRAVVSRQRLAILAEIGDVIEAAGEAPVLCFRDSAAARIFAFAEIAREGLLLLVGNVLAVEDQHGILVHAVLDRARFVCGEGLGEIDAGYFADEMRMKLSNRDRHGASP